MKILLISQVPPLFELKRPSSQAFASLQVQALWLRALHQLGHQTQVFRYTDPILLPSRLSARFQLAFHHTSPLLYSKYRLAKSRYYPLFPANYLRSFRLSRLINSWKPKLILITGGISELLPEPLYQAQQLHIPIFLFHGVHPDLLSTQFERDHLQLFDWIIVNDPTHAQAWLDIGAKNAIALPYAAIDPQFHRRLRLTPSTQQRLSSDVCFAGTLFPNRQRELLGLVHRFHSLHLYGHLHSGTPLLPSLQPYYRGPIWGKDLVRIYNATKIALNFLPDHMPTGGNLRTFEIPGSGAFQLASRTDPCWFTPDQEIVTFSSNQELLDKITHYLNHPSQRKAIAAAGYRRAHRDHTYKKRFQHIISLI